LPRAQDEPVFHEPWQAHAFALVLRLVEAGCFTWAEWAACLSREIAAARDPATGYYEHWLSALERLCADKGLVSPATRERRKEQWRQAYLHTPHGKPVDLSAAPPP
jgi:nitrile hydratase accessory protein